MSETRLNAKSVAVIGAGAGGIAAAIHLRRVGLDVKVFERSAKAGGIWVYDERISVEPPYPATKPSVGDSPEYEALLDRRSSRQDSPLEQTQTQAKENDLSRIFAPPGPCYNSLKNNVSTIEMELSCEKWKPSTEDFVPHHELAQYLQDTARNNGVLEATSFNTRVDKISKTSSQKWQVDTSKLTPDASAIESQEKSLFDAVVVANGNYHAPNIPSIPGLEIWRKAFPTRIFHSKNYRDASEFHDENILLIGAGVSSADIARDLGPIARTVFQSSRGGMYDLTSLVLPDNAARVDGIYNFSELLKGGGGGGELAEDGSLPGTITLKSGKKLCGIHRVILCTGYHISFPFLRELHVDGVRPELADESVLVTNGQQTHNLHKDIWYINDPSLAFIGVPYHIATWSLFEFQAIAVAATFSGRVPLPSRAAMREEYTQKLQRKGAGRSFHSLKAQGEEIVYVEDLVQMVNSGRQDDEELLQGHSPSWRRAYGRRWKRFEVFFGQVRDREIDERVLSTIASCR
ncbi:related to FAD dependent oxidoreductase [Ramularia collo-cygni]|uniref:Related to FAD dependent oxidoreductase n=1 Tax=Ramularia collo-cygni TaxID=112498 RepID=A0A2D3VBP3_9PEZI|nr:related to FAD dependent oxidoreductase [Ramularia collo-cygni]CZT24400.1 related to FAD dependent oxidoreductase [Ramularia collo-cygni]